MLYFENLDSTNTYLKENFFKFPDCTSVTAAAQSAGRGRLGRKWCALPGKSIAYSVKLERLAAPFHAGVILGLAALEVLSCESGSNDIYFKWPNDLYAGKSKLAGILSEGVLQNGGISGVVAGIGINVNTHGDENGLLPPEAVSLSDISGRQYDVKFLLSRLDKSVKAWYINYVENGTFVLNCWKKANKLIGQQVVLHTPAGETITGIFREIAGDGALILTRPDGRDFRFDCGDVSLRF